MLTSGGEFPYLMITNMKPTRLYIFFFILLFLGIAPSASAKTYTYPELHAEAAVLMDAKTGQILFEKNLHQRHYPASITKVMTGLLALEKGNLTDLVTMSNEAVFSIGRNSSHVALDVHEELTLEEALYALAIASANDAANGIAEHISGSLEHFARAMNEKAIAIGAGNTHFVNPHGLPDDNHYTTAHDMAIIMKEAIETPKFTQIFSAVYYEIPPTNKQPEVRCFHSRNALLNGNSRYPGILASKSGWTSQANNTLVTAAEQENRKLIVVVLNVSNRALSYEDTVNLLDYGFQEFMDYPIDLTDLQETMPEVRFTAAAQESLVRLLHRSLSPDVLKKDYEIFQDADESAQAILSLSIEHPQHFMYRDLGSIFLHGEILNETETNPVAADDSTVSNHEKRYFTGGMGLLGFYFFVAYVKRKKSLHRNRLKLPRKFRY